MRTHFQPKLPKFGLSTEPNMPGSSLSTLTDEDGDIFESSGENRRGKERQNIRSILNRIEIEEAELDSIDEQSAPENPENITLEELKTQYRQHYKRLELAWTKKLALSTWINYLSGEIGGIGERNTSYHETKPTNQGARPETTMSSKKLRQERDIAAQKKQLVREEVHKLEQEKEKLIEMFEAFPGHELDYKMIQKEVVKEEIALYRVDNNLSKLNYQKRLHAAAQSWETLQAQRALEAEKPTFRDVKYYATGVSIEDAYTQLFSKPASEVKPKDIAKAVRSVNKHPHSYDETIDYLKQMAIDKGSKDNQKVLDTYMGKRSQSHSKLRHENHRHSYTYRYLEVASFPAFTDYCLYRKNITKAFPNNPNKRDLNIEDVTVYRFNINDNTRSINDILTEAKDDALASLRFSLYTKVSRFMDKRDELRATLQKELIDAELLKTYFSPKEINQLLAPYN